MDVSSYYSNRYGPSLVGKNYGGSEISSNVFTTTGGAEEIVAPGVTGGPAVLAVPAARMNGTAIQENVTGARAVLAGNPPHADILTTPLARSRGRGRHARAPLPGPR